MKKILLFILSLWCVSAMSQSKGYLRYDSLYIQKIGGNATLIIENATRGVTNGVLTNIGNGRTAFVTPSGGSNTSIGSGFDFGWTGTNNIRRFLPYDGLSGDTSGAANTVRAGLGQPIGASGNPAALTIPREIPTSDGLTNYLSFKEIAGTNKVNIYPYGVINMSSQLYAGTSLYIQPGAGTASSGTGWYKGNIGSGTAIAGMGVHWVGTSGGDKHFFMADMRDSILFASVEVGGISHTNFISTALGGGGITQQGLLGKIVVGATLAHTAILADFDNVGSTYLRDSLMLQKRWVVTDSIGGDLLWRSRTAPYEVKQISVPSLAALIGAGGGTTIYTGNGAISGNRSVDVSGLSLDFFGIQTQLQIDDANSDINLTASDDISLDAPTVRIVQTPPLAIDTTNYKHIVRNTTTGDLYRTHWPVGSQGLQSVITNDPVLTSGATNYVDINGGTLGLTFGSTPGSEAGVYISEDNNRISVMGSGGNFHFDASTNTNNTYIGNGSSSDPLGARMYPDSMIVGKVNSGNLVRMKFTTDSIMLKRISTGIIDTTNNKPLAINTPSGGIVQMNSWAQVSGGGSSGLTVGTTTITSGTNKRIPFNDGGVYGEDGDITWDKTDNYLTLANNSSKTVMQSLNVASRDLGAMFINGYYNQALSFNQIDASRSTWAFVMDNAAGSSDQFRLNYWAAGPGGTQIPLIVTPTGISNTGTVPHSGLNTTSLATAYAAKTSTYPITSTDYTIEATSGTFTTTLPTAVGIAGRQYVITNSGSGVLTLATTSSQTFVNVTATPTTLTLNQFNTVIVQSNGANWLRISSL